MSWRVTIAQIEKAYRPDPVSPPVPQLTRPLSQWRGRQITPNQPQAFPRVRPVIKREQRPHGVHPVIVMLALGVSFWFLAAISLTFGRGMEAEYLIAVVLGCVSAFTGLVLLTGSLMVVDPRWRTERAHFKRYLRGRTAIATGSVRGRQAMIQILALPVSLATGVTAIGIVWLAIS